MGSDDWLNRAVSCSRRLPRAWSGRHRASRAFSTPSLPVGSHLVTVAAERRTAPTAVMRFGLVGEPEYAGLILAAFHQSEVGRRQEVSSSFRDRPQNPPGRVLTPDPVDRRRARLVPHQAGMALRPGEKIVRGRSTERAARDFARLPGMRSRAASCQNEAYPTSPSPGGACPSAADETGFAPSTARGQMRR